MVKPTSERNRLSNTVIINYGIAINGTQPFPLAYKQYVSFANSGDYSAGYADNHLEGIDLTQYTFTKRTNLPTLYIALGV